MYLTNNTAYVTDYGLGLAKDGRRVLFIITKATYQIVSDKSQLSVHNKQQAIIEADVATGEPGYSATAYESDFATFKPYCDVLVNGCAYVPDGELDTQVDVGLKVHGHINKSFRVKGHRTWGDTSPLEFNRMPISYNNAFGGIDNTKVQHIRIYQENPVGTGYSYYKKDIDKMPLPNTEVIGRSVSQPNGNYQPMAFGPIGRAWSARAGYAGTYDQQWVENTMPFYPDDFDNRFFQCAPPEQQMPYIRGGEEVTLTNLSPQGELVLQLPELIVPVISIPVNGKAKEYQSNVDTVIIEPEFDRVMMVSRAVIPLRSNIREIKEVIVGNISRQWFHEQRTPSKQFYQSLSEFINEKNKK